MFTKVSSLTQGATIEHDPDNSERLIESVSDTERNLARYQAQNLS